MPRPEHPPAVDIDAVAEGLFQLRRTYELPGPMRLPDLVDLYLELWEEEDF